MGSDESHFKVSLIVRDKVYKTVSTGHNLRRERRAEADSNQGPSAYPPNALPLGQTGPLWSSGGEWSLLGIEAAKNKIHSILLKIQSYQNVLSLLILERARIQMLAAAIRTVLC